MAPLLQLDGETTLVGFDQCYSACPAITLKTHWKTSKIQVKENVWILHAFLLYKNCMHFHNWQLTCFFNTQCLIFNTWLFQISQYNMYYSITSVFLINHQISNFYTLSSVLFSIVNIMINISLMLAVSRYLLQWCILSLD